MANGTRWGVGLVLVVGVAAIGTGFGFVLSQHESDMTVCRSVQAADLARIEANTVRSVRMETDVGHIQRTVDEIRKDVKTLLAGPPG